MAQDPTAHRRSPRPVADAPVGRLADGAVVAKGWLIALVDAAALGAVAQLPTAELSAEGPVLCAAVLEALGSEAALDRLRPGGDRAAIAARAASLAGARTPAAAVAAVEALRGAAWDALESDDAQLAIRLAHVCATVLESVLAAPSGTPPLASTVAPPSEPAVVIRDARVAAEAPEPWRGPIERRLERQAQDGHPFAVLAVEVDDLDRLLSAATGREVVEAIEAAERAICGQLRPADALIRERLGRYWLTAPETDLAAARALGGRMAAAVAAAASHHGAPLAISVGLAVCPQHALNPDALAAHADEGLFAARAAGVRVV